MASPNPNRLSTQLSPFEAAPSRQSPFQRQNSKSPAPSTSPIKTSGLSPVKTTSLSPEKANPFTRRPSQISHAADRPTSPFARPTSSLSIVSSPSRKISNDSLRASEPPRSPLRSTRDPEQTLSRHSSAVPEGLDKSASSITSPSPYDGNKQSSSAGSLSDDSPFSPTPVQALSRDNLRPAMQRNITSSTTATVKQPLFTAQAKSATPKLNGFGGGAYNHLPQPLLHSMRESFEVLDSNNTGTVNSAAVADMLAQLGLDNNPSALKDFFPHNGPAQLNLARYLDILSGPLGELSESDELRAAFEAFDVDDSGQVDISMLRDALLHTAPQPGEDMIRLSEREVDSVLGEFTGRRAFGTKGINAGKAKGEVFRYRDFMASVSGGGASTMSEAEVAMAASC
ncbi:Putative EF-hand domain-containing protein [Septoria linicola]|uniref:EF-hand domain-containing protein n=1 Tax=Septoria linicola TaxID=215465 RepID=A0A9Q9EDP7_9PEZI|nr:putative EF-hand domain-containing protein [Septoria linicola]USW47971.1 Putative EF-hand domain-containing protein [Septoria linicola]